MTGPNVHQRASAQICGSKHMIQRSAGLAAALALAISPTKVAFASQQAASSSSSISNRLVALGDSCTQSSDPFAFLENLPHQIREFFTSIALAAVFGWIVILVGVAIGYWALKHGSWFAILVAVLVVLCGLTIHVGSTVHNVSPTANTCNTGTTGNTGTNAGGTGNTANSLGASPPENHEWS